MKAGIVLLALVTLPLAGCLGGEEPTDIETSSNESLSLASDNALPGNVSAVNATKPADMTGGDAPHIHNYWGEKERITLFDDDLELWTLDGGNFNDLFLKKQVAVGGRWWSLPEGSTVYEGTGQIDLTVTWTDPTITGLSASYKPANTPWTLESFSEPVPLASGTPYTIEVTPEMTDMPHVAVSGWEFRFSAAGTPAVAQGMFHLKMEIVRMRDIMAFPGHPVTYVDTTSYVLADKDFDYKAPSFVSDIASFATGGARPEPLAPDAPVPMGTRALLVEIKVASGSSAAPLAKQSGLDLNYRTAGGNWDYIQPLNSTGDTYVFAIPVEDGDIDSPYGTTSNWAFYPRLRQQSGVPVPGLRGFNCGGCFDQQIQGHIVVTAYEMDPTGKIAPVEDGDDR